jgi:hypothetical protein
MDVNARVSLGGTFAKGASSMGPGSLCRGHEVKE